MIERMHGAYIFTEAVRKVCEHVAKMGSQGHSPCFLHAYQPALLHARTISGLSWVDFLRARTGDCVCSRVFSLAEKRPHSPERSASGLLSGAFHPRGSVGRGHRL